MGEDYPTIHLRFSKSRQPLVKMRVRIMANAVQVEYYLPDEMSRLGRFARWTNDNGYSWVNPDLSAYRARLPINR